MSVSEKASVKRIRRGEVTASCTPDPIVRWETNEPGKKGGKRHGGQKPDGLFPEVSRVKLGMALGLSKSSISNMFKGRFRPSLSVSVRMAKLLGVEINELSDILAKKQEEYQRLHAGSSRKRTLVTQKKQRVGRLGSFSSAVIAAGAE